MKEGSHSNKERLHEFSRFYEDSYDSAYNFLRSLRFPFDHLRDILDRCFEIAWERFDEYIDRGRPRSWLYDILRNKSGYEKRRYAQQGIFRQADVDAVDPRDARPDPETLLLVEERRAEFYRLLQKLPEHYAIVVKLRIQGYDYKTISEMLDISVTNAHTRMKRALTKIEEVFSNYLEDFGE